MIDCGCFKSRTGADEAREIGGVSEAITGISLDYERGWVSFNSRSTKSSGDSELALSARLVRR